MCAYAREDGEDAEVGLLLFGEGSTSLDLVEGYGTGEHRIGGTRIQRS